MYKQTNDEINLVKKAKAGNRSAFEKLVTKHQQRVFNLCYWMLLDSSDTEDATQETFLRAYKGIRKFREKAKFYTWLYRIGINVCKDIMTKKSKREKTFSEIEDEMKLNDTIPMEEITPNSKAITGERALEQKELKKILWQCIAKLSSERRLLIDLVYYKGLQYKEAAAILNWPEGTVKSNVHRALKEIRKCLKKTSLKEIF